MAESVSPELPELPSPVLAIAVAGGRLWVGGLGGVANDGSAGRLPQRPLTAVAALGVFDGVLTAGGAEGIARLVDTPEGARWEPAEVQSGGSPIAALAGSGELLIAATIGDGVLRSTDAGRTWMMSNFGLDELEVTAVAAAPDGTLLAGTANGIYRSRDGRGWRPVAGADGIAIAALAFTQAGLAIAAAEDGPVLRSADGGVTWSEAGSVPGVLTSLAETADGTLFAGTIDAGIWTSTDGGNWSNALADAPEIYCLAADSDRIYAGSSTGLHIGTSAGANWQAVPAPPTHDFTESTLWHGRPLFAGTRSGLAHQTEDGSWTLLSDTPLPLLCVAVTPKDALLASGPGGLYLRSGDSWTCLVDGEDGQIGRMSFRPDGTGLASSATHGGQLLRTRDGGMYWQPISAPFGALPPIELQLFEETVMVKTLDRRTNVLTVWGSRDDGTSWEIVWQGPEG